MSWSEDLILPKGGFPEMAEHRRFAWDSALGGL